MNKKTILNHGLTLGLVSLFSINLTSCNNTKKEFIEVGLKVGNHTSMEMNPWLEFYTGLKAKTQKDKKQDIEVFYGNSIYLDNVLDKENYESIYEKYESINQKFEIDNSQVLEFKLTRYVYSSEDDAIHNQVSKSKEILSIKNTLGYFMSDEFRLEENSMIDTIEAKDLVQDYEEYGVIHYKFSITPIENESIKIFIDDKPVYLDNSIDSYHNSVIDYVLNEQKQIKFIEREEIRKEDAKW